MPTGELTLCLPGSEGNAKEGVTGSGVLGQIDPLAAPWAWLLLPLESPWTSPSGWHSSCLRIQLQGLLQGALPDPPALEGTRITALEAPNHCTFISLLPCASLGSGLRPLLLRVVRTQPSPQPLTVACWKYLLSHEGE